MSQNYDALTLLRDAHDARLDGNIIVSFTFIHAHIYRIIALIAYDQNT